MADLNWHQEVVHKHMTWMKTLPPITFGVGGYKALTAASDLASSFLHSPPNSLTSASGVASSFLHPTPDSLTSTSGLVSSFLHPTQDSLTSTSDLVSSFLLQPPDSLTSTSGLASSFLHPSPDSSRKGCCFLYAGCSMPVPIWMLNFEIDVLDVICTSCMPHVSTCAVAKLKILSVLMNQLLTFASCRDYIDESAEKLKQIQRSLRAHQYAEIKRERDEAQFW